MQDQIKVLAGAAPVAEWSYVRHRASTLLKVQGKHKLSIRMSIQAVAHITTICQSRPEIQKGLHPRLSGLMCYQGRLQGRSRIGTNQALGC